MITSLNNATVRATTKLHKRRERQRRGAFLVEGHRAVAVALDSSVPVAVLLHLSRGRDRTSLMDAAALGGAKLSEVSEPVMRHVTGHAHPPSFVAIALARPTSLARATAGDFCVVLSGIHDPSVAGGVMAAAAAAGATGIVAAGQTVDLLTPACVRAAGGAHFALPFAEATDDEVAQVLSERRLLAMDRDGQPVCSQSMLQPIGIVLSEAEVSPSFQRADRVAPHVGLLGVRGGIVAEAAVLLHHVAEGHLAPRHGGSS